MKINSVKNQNYTKKQVNFGCDFCRLTKEMLVGHGFQGHEVESVLLRVNPKTLGPKAVNELRKINVTPEKLHYGRASQIYDSITAIQKTSNSKNKLKPEDLEAFVVKVRSYFDDMLALETGNNFILYV